MFIAYIAVGIIDKVRIDAIKEFEKVVDKCIKDDFDYTIELYGTKPLPKGDPMQILID